MRGRGPGARQFALFAAVPVLGVVASVLTNLITAGWNTWVFGGLVTATAVLAVTTFLTARNPGEPPAIAPAPSHRAVGGLSVPRGSRVFSGRAREQELLAAATGDGRRPTVIVISGVAGVGKTELAIQVAESCAERYPDGCFWVALRTYAVTAESRVETAQVLRTLLYAFGEQPDPSVEDPAELSARFRAATADARLLLVLDDANDAAQVVPLLPAGGRSAVLVTSRHVLVGLDADLTVELQPLDRGEAELMAERILRGGGRLDRAAVTAIADRYRLPLALRQICDLRMGNPMIGLADLTAPGEAELGDAAAALAMSLNALDDDARRLLGRISRFPGSFVTERIGVALAGRSVEEARPLLAHLYQRGLLSSDGPGYRMHDIVRDAAFRAAATWDRAEDLAAAETRAFDHLVSAVYAAVAMLYPGGDFHIAPEHLDPAVGFDSDLDALAWLDRYYADVTASCRHALATSQGEVWLMLAWLEYYQRIRGFFEDAITLNSAALEQARSCLARALSEHNLGIIRARLGDRDTARRHLEEAIRLYTEAGEPIGLPAASIELAKIERANGDLEAAYRHATTALTLAENAGGPTDQGSAYRQLGVIALDRDDHTAARLHFTTALTLYQRVRHRRGIASTYRELGRLELATLNLPDARSHLQQAAALYRSLGDEAYEADTTVELGRLARSEGDETTATRLWTEALTTYNRLNLPLKAATAERLLHD